MSSKKKYIGLFEEIPNGLFLDNSVEYRRIEAIEWYIHELSKLWDKIATAGNNNEAKAAYKELQDSKIKIVDLRGVVPEELVFLGGSRRKRQSKKRKNHKKHNNNQ